MLHYTYQLSGKHCLETLHAHGQKSNLRNVCLSITFITLHVQFYKTHFLRDLTLDEQQMQQTKFKYFVQRVKNVLKMHISIR